MYTDFYKLRLDPFRLTPDHRFAYPHASYADAQTQMRLALEQGDGILVVSGPPGAGKTTLVQDFLAKLDTADLLTGHLVSTHLDNEMLRMVAYALGMEAGELQGAHLQRELEVLLHSRPRALLIIDEAQNLSDEALEDLRLLTSLRAGLQIFLLGQEELYERLQAPGADPLRQHVTMFCQLEPLNLQATCDYVLHRLGLAGWIGNPALAAESIILINRFCRGLPRYICKLGSRLLMHGAEENLSAINVDTVAEVILSMQQEGLLPSKDAVNNSIVEPLPDLLDLKKSKVLPEEKENFLSSEEQEFLSVTPALLNKPPDNVAPLAQSDYPAAQVSATGLDRLRNHLRDYYGNAVRGNSVVRYAAVTLLLLIGAYQLGGLITAHRLSGENPGSAEAVAGGSLQDPVTGTATVSQAAIAAYGQATSDAVPPPPEPDKALKPSDTVARLSESAVYGDPVEVADSNEMAPSENIDNSVGSAAIATQMLSTDTDDKLEEIAVRSTPLSTPSLAVTTDVTRPEAVDTEDADAEEISAATTDEKIELLLAQGEQAIAQFYLLTPKEQSAYYYYQQVLLLDPGNAAAKQGLQQIPGRYALLARSMLEQENYDLAQLYVRRGLGMAGDDGDLLAVQQELTSRQQALQEAMAESEAEVVREETPETGGLFGALKRLFTGGEADPLPE